MKDRKKPNKSDEEVVLIEDLDPRDDVRGGTMKLRFGESIPPKRPKGRNA